jgi:hypothetical protein
MRCREFGRPGEQLQVATFDRAVERVLQGVEVGDVDVVDVDAFFGQQWRQIAQHLVGEPRLELDLRHPWWWFRAAPTHVRHAPILAAPSLLRQSAPTRRNASS